MITLEDIKPGAILKQVGIHTFLHENPIVKIIKVREVGGDLFVWHRHKKRDGFTLPETFITIYGGQNPNGVFSLTERPKPKVYGIVKFLEECENRKRR